MAHLVRVSHGGEDNLVLLGLAFGEIVAVGNQAFWSECLARVDTEVVLAAGIAQEIDLIALTDCRDLGGKLRR